MSVTINLIFWGDEWINRDSIIKQLCDIPIDDQVIMHTQHEGISLRASGVLEVIDKWVSTTNRSPDTVLINTPNHYEKINYKFDNKLSLHPHFFKPGQLDYYRNYSQLTKFGKLFGLFLGRYTQVRNIIAADIIADYRQHFLISIMQGDRLEASQWWNSEIETIGSLDHMTIDNQYDGNHNTNQSLLTFYNDFQIELVVETVTLGEAFFPTEKTIRPIMGSKPFIIYAYMDFLKNIQELGFRTFSELWSEEYDQLEGIPRWNCIKLLIANIIEQGYDCNIANEIVQYNYNYLQKIISANKINNG